jgi:hypothetical protein
MINYTTISMNLGVNTIIRLALFVRAIENKLATGNYRMTKLVL